MLMPNERRRGKNPSFLINLLKIKKKILSHIERVEYNRNKMKILYEYFLFVVEKGV